VLVGDAAHTMPAYKGLGVNSAIQSAQNLACKLAAVIHGRACAGLLGTYHAERHPVGRFAARQSLTGPAAQWLVEGTRAVNLPTAPDLPFFFPIAGYRYRSDAVIAASEDAGPPDEIAFLDRQEFIGVPGTRVPHIWLESNRKRISTLDLFDGPLWC
jgi:putative polyketide hydroxylase